MEKIQTNKAPEAIGPYSQAIAWNELLFTSGQIPIVPSTGELAGETIKEQAKQVMENLQAVLAEGGSDCSAVLKTTCFLKDMKYFAEFNEVYAEYFPDKPARSCVACRELPKDVLCEVEAVAVRKNNL